MKIFDDPIEFIKNKPKMFLRGNNIGLELSTNIVGDVLLLTGGAVTVLKENDWWIIGGEKDWLELSSNYTMKDFFSRMIPFPEAGQNSIHAEILLTAFCNEVITVTNGVITVIKGNSPEDYKHLFASKTNTEFKRIVAFRCN